MTGARFCKFLLTRPLRDVTLTYGHVCSVLLISTHTPLTGRDIDVMVELSQQRISTHTPLTGRDEQKMQLLLNEIISTHTPLTGRDIPL